MKTINKLQINPERIMKNNELTIIRGGYTVNGCSDGWDKWICAFYYQSIRLSGDFCVPSGFNADGAKEWIEGNHPYYSIIYCV